ncbi:Cell division topological specificity factor [wastewater metagenome]|uniref:Cell division topological specificity factor n=2 Tax=unclassified sequences TaxID=12908 RepID=A0A5B8RD32_9ZZZZ|nr:MULTISPECIES: cell division topological specificity factor MinE [Arhodomonas]MCS4502523.1 cell division topological specificity factor MinE [Arhodomonas aquaeolei]QEA06949.1 cell division topological specificity factor [uncultured organism]
MSFLDYFRSEKRRSASVAKERLQIIVARERSGRGGPDYLPKLQEELLSVIRKYVQVSDDAVRMEVEHEGNCDVLELNITLPEGGEGNAQTGRR